MNKIENLCEKYNGVVHNSYPGYIICKQGEIYSIKRKRFLDKTLRKRNPQDINSKYDEMVHLLIEGRGKTVSVHRLLATAFINNPNNKGTVNHIDGNPSNNALDNLEWATQSENSIHAHSLDLVGGSYTKCTSSRVIFNEIEVSRYRSLQEASVLTGISASLISNVAVKNKVVTSVDTVPYTSNGYVWRYEEIEKEVYATPVTYTSYNLDEVEHKILDDYPRYAVTIDGRIYDISKNRWLKLTLVTPKGNTLEAPFVSCSINIAPNKYKNIRVARVVAKYFREEWRAVGHKDNNVCNCSADNLAQVGQTKGNIAVVAYKLGWKETEVVEYDSVAEMAENTGVSKDVVNDAIILNKAHPPHTKFKEGRLPAQRSGFVFRGLSKT